MTPDDVTQGLLKSVSRSFFLSVRILPPELRETMGVAYLLARISDTIADTESAPIPTRLRRLADFGAMVHAGTNPTSIASIQKDIQPSHAGERALMAALPQVLERLGAFKPWEWKETQELLANIIRGQSGDLQTFTDPGTVTALPDGDALEDYIYLVAGCVGEWWTRVCFHHYPKYADKTEAELLPLAGSFGKALQLVNILRDMPADLRAGRCYLPADQLLELGVDAAMLSIDPTAAQPVFDRWLAQARAYLDQAADYIASLQPWRIRVACYLPWRLAGQTLDLMQVTSPLVTQEKVKVRRGDVYRAMFRSLSVAVSNLHLR